jgi:hypothetical protein
MTPRSGGTVYFPVGRVAPTGSLSSGSGRALWRRPQPRSTRTAPPRVAVTDAALPAARVGEPPRLVGAEQLVARDDLAGDLGDPDQCAAELPRRAACRDDRGGDLLPARAGLCCAGNYVALFGYGRRRACWSASTARAPRSDEAQTSGSRTLLGVAQRSYDGRFPPIWRMPPNRRRAEIRARCSECDDDSTGRPAQISRRPHERRRAASRSDRGAALADGRDGGWGDGGDPPAPP